MPDGPQVGVLVMAYGGPQQLNDLPGYLADIRSGRPTPRRVLNEISGNYDAIGGSSPILERTQQQAAGIAKCLDSSQFRVYVGMRHWSPWIEETISHMLDDGIERAVGLVLAPQFSALSTARYQARIAEGLRLYRGHMDFAHIDSYHDAPGLISSLAQRVAEGISRWNPEDRENVHVVFTAHSLPSRIAGSGDPYPSQTKETGRLTAQRAGLDDSRWSFSYQSAGRSNEPWLEPSLRDHLSALAQRGILQVVIVPVGFVSDHVEILYDIDIDARRFAAGLGMRLERPPSLNDDPVFTAELARLVSSRAAEAGWT